MYVCMYVSGVGGVVRSYDSVHLILVNIEVVLGVVFSRLLAATHKSYIYILLSRL